jgi:hypothetical protein
MSITFNLKVVDFSQPDVHMLFGAASLAMVTAAWGLVRRYCSLLSSVPPRRPRGSGRTTLLDLIGDSVNNLASLDSAAWWGYGIVCGWVSRLLELLHTAQPWLHNLSTEDGCLAYLPSEAVRLCLNWM